MNATETLTAATTRRVTFSQKDRAGISTMQVYPAGTLVYVTPDMVRADGTILARVCGTLWTQRIDMVNDITPDC